MPLFRSITVDICICMHHYVFYILCMDSDNKIVSIKLKIDIFNHNTIFIIVVHEWTLDIFPKYATSTY